MKRTLPALPALLFLFACVLPAVAPAQDQTQDQTQDQGGSGPAAATVVKVSPQARIFRAGGQGSPLHEGDAVQVGDRVATDAHGRLTLVLSDGSEVAMMNNSDFTVKALGQGGAGGGLLHLLKGIVQGAVHKLNGQRFEIETATGVTAVKGTEYQVEAADGHTELKVLSGHVELRDAAGKSAVLVGPGQAALSYPDRVGALRTMNRDEVQALRDSFLARVRQAQGDYLKRVRAIQGGN